MGLIELILFIALLFVLVVGDWTIALHVPNERHNIGFRLTKTGASFDLARGARSWAQAGLPE